MVTRLRRTGVSKQPYTDTDVPLHTLVADTIGPSSTYIDGHMVRTPSIGGNLYTLNVMCVATRHVWTRTLKAKSDTAKAVISILRKLMNRYSQYKLVRFHTDGGKEFVNAELGAYLDTNGIEHTYTTRNHPQHNGKIERLNQTLINLARSMLTECKAPIQLWGDAIIHASYVYNHTPLKVIGMLTPIQKLTGQQPDLSKIKVFGCNAFYALPDTQRSKFQPTFTRGVWIGHSTKQNASRILTDYGRVVVTIDVKLDEDSFSHMSELIGIRAPMEVQVDVNEGDSYDPFLSTTIQHSDTSTATQSIRESDEPKPVPHVHPNDPASTDAGPNMEQADGMDVDYSPASSNDQSINDTTNTDSTIHIPDLSLPTTRSGRVSKPIFRYGIGSAGDYGIEDVIMSLIGNEAEPTTYKQAVSCRHADQWKETMNKEIASMSGQDVFQLVPRTKDMNVIKSRWVYKIKTDASNLPTV